MINSAKHHDNFRVVKFLKITIFLMSFIFCFFSVTGQSPSNFDNLIKKGMLVAKSQIAGDFEGFDDDILFPLINGQYWIQKKYKYWYHYSYRARVSIYQYGKSFYLTVDGQEAYVAVEQIEDVIKATITNDFNGWSGDTIFELDNGQVWKQNAYAYDYNYAYRPDAFIYLYESRYYLLVDGEKVGVERIQ